MQVRMNCWCKIAQKSNDRKITDSYYDGPVPNKRGFFLILFLEITRITKVDTFWFSFYAFYHAARVEVYSHGFCEPVR